MVVIPASAGCRGVVNSEGKRENETICTYCVVHSIKYICIDLCRRPALLVLLGLAATASSSSASLRGLSAPVQCAPGTYSPTGFSPCKSASPGASTLHLNSNPVWLFLMRRSVCAATFERILLEGWCIIIACALHRVVGLIHTVPSHCRLLRLRCRRDVTDALSARHPPNSLQEHNMYDFLCLLVSRRLHSACPGVVYAFQV